MRFTHTELPYYISMNYNEFNTEKLHRWLNVDAYWSAGIPFEVMDKAFRNSLCFGLFHDGIGQVGVARMITDTSTFAYLADVFICDDHRGAGLGKWLIDTVMAHPELQGLRRMMLATSDMHSLYAQFGFENVQNNNKILMEIVKPDLYKPT